MSPCSAHLSPSDGGPSKRAFRTRALASAAVYTIRKRGDSREKKPVRAFMCEGCGRWFLTSLP
jgi:hypothetical protein